MFVRSFLKNTCRNGLSDCAPCSAGSSTCGLCFCGVACRVELPTEGTTAAEIELESEFFFYVIWKLFSL